MKKIKQNKGITLVALVMTVIVLLILSGVAINAMKDTNLIGKSEKATEEYKKKAATEIINLKITNIQISNYVEKQKMPTLQELADGLCDDNEMEYVLTTSKNVANLGKLDKIVVGEASSLFAKLKAYPYEFEINSSLQLASIDGIKVATTPTNDEDTIVSMTKKELKQMIQDEIKAATITTNNNYSTTEQVVGTWIDGKPLYQKTLVSNMPDCKTDGTQVFNFVNIGAAVDYGMILNCAIENPYSTPSTSWYAMPFNDKTMNYFNINNNYNTSSQNTLRIGNSTKNFNGAKIIVTIQYTKTTD